MKKKSAIFGIIGILVLATILGAFTQTGENLFQRALRLERNEGKLMEAIELYNKVVSETGNKTLAAKAQLRIGLCYEKLGSKSVEQARKAFQKVVDNFPAQSDEVKIAKEKLAILTRARAAIDKSDTEFNLKKVLDKAVDTFFMGAPSPDGRYVTYVDWNNFGNLGVHDLIEKKNRILTSNKSWDTAESAYNSIFSPDGRRITYTWQVGGGAELRTIGIDGGRPRTLCKDPGWPIPVSWSSDGSRILMFLNHRESLDIAFVSVNDGSIHKIKSFPNENPTRFMRMSLSPDGEYIAFGLKQEAGSTNLDIHVMSSDGLDQTQLVKHPANDVILGWTPDGNHVLFKSDRTGSPGIWMVPVINGKSGGEPQLVRAAPGDIQPLDMTPGGALYFGLGSGWSDIFIAEIDPDTGKVASPPVKAVKKYERSNSAPDWSSDGEYLVCRSAKGKVLAGGEIALLVRSTQTEEIREVTPLNIKGLNFHFIRMSPDGRSVLGVGSDDVDNYGALWTIDVQTGESKILARPVDDAPIYQPNWAPDGQSIYFIRKHFNWRANIRRIFRLDVASGQETEILSTPLSILNLTLSPDGNRFAFIGDDGLYLIPVSGGEPQKLSGMKDVNTVTWSADGRFLFFGKRRDARSDVVEVWRIPFEGGEPLKTDLSMINLMHIRMHPDGKKLAFTGSLQPATSEIWVMENFLPIRKNDK